MDNFSFERRNQNSAIEIGALVLFSWLVALFTSILIILAYAKHHRIGLTDQTLQRLLFALCGPFARLDYQIIKIRTYTANILDIGQALVTV